MSGRARRALLSAAPIERGVNTVATVLQRRLERRAVAIGPEAHLRRTLVLAPHPDDEVLGCGAAMWHKRQAGTEVTVVVATDGRHSHRSAHLSADELAAVREEESQRACARLGVHDDAIRFLRHPERSLVERQGELRAQLLAVLEEVEPQEVLLPCGIDRLEDHRALNRAAHAALRALIGSGAPPRSRCTSTRSGYGTSAPGWTARPRRWRSALSWWCVHCAPCPACGRRRWRWGRHGRPKRRRWPSTAAR
ncbi:MAG: PIG-L family deacetylase [Acidimicrobiales bacterium]